MQKYAEQPLGARLVIMDGAQMWTCSLEQKQRWKLGRFDPNQPGTPDILLTSSTVSRTHGWLEKIDEEWFYIDNPGNLNGTFYNGTKIPRPRNGMKSPILLDNGDVLRIEGDGGGDAPNSGVLMYFTTDAVSGAWAVYPLGEETTCIGFDAERGAIGPMPHCAEAYARILRLNGSYYLTDCAAGTGVVCNGRPARSGAKLRERDVISFGRCKLIFLGDRLLYAARG